MFKILNSIFLLLIFLSSTSSFAADDGDWWLQRQIQLQQNREDYARRVYGSARHTYDTVDTITSKTKTKTITKTVIVEDVPSKAKLGKGLLERSKAFKGGVAGVLGGAAVTALIEGVGWVMEDGTFVKYKDKEIQDEAPTNKIWIWNGCGTLQSCLASGYADKDPKAVCDKYGSNHPSNLQTQGFSKTSETTGVCTYKSTSIKQYLKLVDYVDQQEPKKEKIVITDHDVGGIVSGDYQDPVDSNYNITDKKYRPVVADAYQHDPSGIGNDLAIEMDEKIKTAPPTPDGKPAPIGDPRYAQPSEQDQRTNDRSWGDDTANEATGDTTPNTDPTTGQPTGGQSISLQFPIFCEWAHTMCKWYDDWKKSDLVYKDHMTKTEEHQTQEKGFWQSVKDWFDWTKDDSELPDRDDSDLNPTVDFEEKNISLNVSPLCPAPTFETITLHGVTSQVKTSDYTYICQLDWLIKPFIIGFATIMACFILFGFNLGSEE